MIALIAPASVLAFGGAMFIASQALTVNRGIAAAKMTTQESPAFTAAFATIIVSVCIFWALLLAQGIPDGAAAVRNAAPSSSLAYLTRRCSGFCTSGALKRSARASPRRLWR
ncbi:hypothetical protein [Natrinema gelatinilyticum]|uniref:hypothetical protein n=1 Tax=Natrinema gelatinilyticum TaxID=2961571 RepID=UPI0020C51024|nr:hypothetical protein [Natrinema gelatinilyticum]